MSEKVGDGVHRTETVGEIGDVEVAISIEGDNELLAGLILSDLESRADEIKQMVDNGIRPEGTQPIANIDWATFLSADEVEPI